MADFGDIRTKNLFKESNNDVNHLNVFAVRQYNRTDLAILVLVVMGTVLVNKYILTKKNNKDDVTQINQIYRDLNTKEAKLDQQIKSKQQMVMYLKFFQKVFLVILCTLAFWSYKSPDFFQYIFYELMSPHISLFVVISVFFVSHYYIEYQVKRVLK